MIGSNGPIEEPRPRGEHSPGQRCLGGLLAERLQPTVRLAGDLLDRRIGEPGDRPTLAHPGREVGVDREARDEGVVADGAPERLGHRAHLTGKVAARVDDGVPRSATKRRQVAVPVATDPLDFGEEVGFVLAAVEEGYGVPALERGGDDVAAEEQRAADDE